MITHQELTDHLNLKGFDIVDGESDKEYIALSVTEGVCFKWDICHGNGHVEDYRACPDSTHLHFAVCNRLAAGKPFGAYCKPFVLADIRELDNWQGAPAARTKIDKSCLPPPYRFTKLQISRDRDFRYGHQWWHRNLVIVSAFLYGPVGIANNAKVSSDIAAVPGEPIWWSFKCHGVSTASFDMITDGEFWYPINQRSERITTQLNPKKSLDLSKMSIADRDFLIRIIEDYTSSL